MPCQSQIAWAIKCHPRFERHKKGSSAKFFGHLASTCRLRKRRANPREKQQPRLSKTTHTETNRWHAQRPFLWARLSKGSPVISRYGPAQ